MDNSLQDSFENRFNSFKATWSKLTFDQKISLTVMLFLLFALPVGIVLSIKPTRFFSHADFPITPPITSPVTPTTTNTVTPTLNPSITTIPTQTPTVSVTPTPFSSEETPTPTLIPPHTNIAPRITTSRFKSGSVGKYLERTIEAEDRNGDQLVFSAANLPTGLIFGDCGFVIKGSGALVVRCKVKGTPTQGGIFPSEFVVNDIWGAMTRKTIFFTILP